MYMFEVCQVKMSRVAVLRNFVVESTCGPAIMAMPVFSFPTLHPPLDDFSPLYSDICNTDCIDHHIFPTSKEHRNIVQLLIKVRRRPCLCNMHIRTNPYFTIYVLCCIFRKSVFEHCTMCILSSMFTFQPNKLRHILKDAS